MSNFREMISVFQTGLEEVLPEIRAGGSRLVNNRIHSGINRRTIPEINLNESLPFNFIPPTQSELLQSISKSSPECSVLLGVGADEAAFHLDLDNPISGAVLIIGDDNSDKVGLMRSILASAAKLNLPEHVSTSVICRQVDSYIEFVDTRSLQEIMPCDEIITSEFILEIVNEARERMNGKRPTPAVVLFIDDLAECQAFLNKAAYEGLYWLIRHGPRYRIWTIASLPSAKYTNLNEQFLDAFRTRLIGHIADKGTAEIAAQSRDLPTQQLRPDWFYTPYRDEKLVICICPIQ